MANDTAKAVAVSRSLTGVFAETARQATPFYPNLCTVVNSRGADEGYGMLGAMPAVREWLGERKFETLRAQDFTIKNKHWESSLLVSKNDIADDRLGMYGPLMQNLAIEATYHPDELVMAETTGALALAESTACFDGQFLIDTDHSYGDSGTQSNDLTQAAATGTQPTTDEFKTAYDAAYQKLLSYKADNGKFFNRPIANNLDLIVLVAPNNERPAREALQAALLVNGGTNIVIGTPRIVVSPYVAATKMYLINAGGVLRPFIFQARQPLSFATKGEMDLETKDVKFMTEARYNVGMGAWWTIVLTTFT